jgi:hypothetical protein
MYIALRIEIELIKRLLAKLMESQSVNDSASFNPRNLDK